MLTIRFFRIGKRNQPMFKIVVTDSRKPPKGGRFVEEVGSFSPLTKQKVFKADRIKYWLSVGAKPSATVHNLFVQEKILDAKKIQIPIAKPAKKQEGIPLSSGSAATNQPVSKEVKEDSGGSSEQKPAETPVAPTNEQPPVASN